MRISDWSSDVCSSDLRTEAVVGIIRIATSGRKGHLPRFSGRRFGHHRAAQVIRENCATGALRYADEFAQSLTPDRIAGCGDAGHGAMEYPLRFPDDRSARKSTRLTSSH